MAAGYLKQWLDVLDGGVDDVVESLTGTDEASLRAPPEQSVRGRAPEKPTAARRCARSVEHWDHEHSAA